MKSPSPLLVCALVISTVTIGSALPKFAARTGAKCQSCHVNPTGKGMRLEFGQTYGRDDITLPAFKELTDYDEFSTSLTSNISIGGDFRNMLLYDESSKSTSFFQMQGDLYFDFRLNKKLRILFNRRLYGDGFELMGIARVLPLDGYVKIGKFLPAYGTRVDDHNIYIRDRLAFGRNKEDTGVELGIAPGIATITIGLFNGNPGAGGAAPYLSKDKAVAVRGDLTFKHNVVNATVGGSYYDATASGVRRSYAGAFGSLGLFEALSLHGEFDIAKVTQLGATTTGYVLWTELNYMVTQGIDLKAGYQFYDPDKDLATGTESRITLGVEFFLLSGLEIRPQYYFNIEQPTDLKNNEFQVMTHLFF